MGTRHLWRRGGGRDHFGKPAARLTRYQAALMAAALPNPIERVAGKPSREVKRLVYRIQRPVVGTLPYIHCCRVANQA